MQPWYYQGEPLVEAPDGYQGFVYRIHDRINEMYYVGKKNFRKVRKLKPLKGKTNKRHRQELSDWQEYYGSSTRLQEAVRLFGPDPFEREILVLCSNKNTMNYWEMKIQFELNVLTDPTYYNEYIGGRVNSRGLNI